MNPGVHLPVATAKQSWRALAAALRPEALGLLGAAGLVLLASACGLLVPALLGRIVDLVISGDAFELVIVAVAGIVVSGVCAAAFFRIGGGLLVRGLQRSLARLRERVFAVAIRLDQRELEAAGSSDAVSRVTADVDAVSDAVSTVLPRTIQAVFAILLTFAGLAALDLWLACAAFLAVPVQLVSTVRFLRRSRPLYYRLRSEESARGQALIESVRGADTIIAHRDDVRHLHRVSDRSLVAVETGRTAAKARNGFYAGLNFAEFLGLAAVLATGFWLNITTAFTVGSVTAAALFFHRLFDPIGSLLSSIDDLQRAAAGLGRLAGVLQAQPAEVQRRLPVDSAVEVAVVCYRYRDDAALVLRDVSLHLPPGSTTVFVGASGSGKSTLARLIAGVLTPSQGSVRIGGVPADRIDTLAATGRGRRAVMLVTQETHRFVGTLADNLRLVASEANDDALIAALLAVGASWYAELPAGLETPLESHVDSVIDDAKLQQVALARVLLADPAVVILDEVTAYAGAESVLDTAVEAVVQGRTAIIVAHRFTQAHAADLIAVFEAGELVESGSHAELVAEGGQYARLRGIPPVT